MSGIRPTGPRGNPLFLDFKGRDQEFKIGLEGPFYKEEETDGGTKARLSWEELLLKAKLAIEAKTPPTNGAFGLEAHYELKGFVPGSSIAEANLNYNQNLWNGRFILKPKVGLRWTGEEQLPPLPRDPRKRSLARGDDGTLLKENTPGWDLLIEAGFLLPGFDYGKNILEFSLGTESFYSLDAKLSGTIPFSQIFYPTWKLNYNISRSDKKDFGGLTGLPPGVFLQHLIDAGVEVKISVFRDGKGGLVLAVKYNGKLDDAEDIGEDNADIHILEWKIQLDFPGIKDLVFKDEEAPAGIAAHLFLEDWSFLGDYIDDPDDSYHCSTGSCGGRVRDAVDEQGRERIGGTPLARMRFEGWVDLGTLVSAGPLTINAILRGGLEFYLNSDLPPYPVGGFELAFGFESELADRRTVIEVVADAIDDKKRERDPEFLAALAHDVEVLAGKAKTLSDKVAKLFLEDPLGIHEQIGEIGKLLKKAKPLVGRLKGTAGILRGEALSSIDAYGEFDVNALEAMAASDNAYRALGKAEGHLEELKKALGEAEKCSYGAVEETLIAMRVEKRTALGALREMGVAAPDKKPDFYLKAVTAAIAADKAAKGAKEILDNMVAKSAGATPGASKICSDMCALAEKGYSKIEKINDDLKAALLEKIDIRILESFATKIGEGDGGLLKGVRDKDREISAATTRHAKEALKVEAQELIGEAKKYAEASAWLATLLRERASKAQRDYDSYNARIISLGSTVRPAEQRWLDDLESKLNDWNVIATMAEESNTEIQSDFVAIETYKEDFDTTGFF